MTPTPKDPVDALMALAKECGATVYAHRTSPHEPAVAFSPSAWEAFSARALAAVPASQAEENAALWATLIKLADFLGIDATEARKAPGNPSDVFIAAIRAQQAGGVPAVVSWQVRRTDGSPLAVWESCTQELFNETKRTGRYAGYEGAPPCEVRELVALAAAPSPSAVQPLSEARRVHLDEWQVMAMAMKAGFNLEPTANMLYTVRGNAAQVINLVHAVEAAHGIVTPKEPTP